jgi:hypothetical protein
LLLRFGERGQVLKYPCRYTHRVAIANSRLTFVGNGQVHCAYVDHADHQTRKQMTLSAIEFLRRFTLRDRGKVSTQWRLFTLVHNSEKIAHTKAV